MKNKLMLLTIVLSINTAFAQTFYVDVNSGDDNALGTFSAPWENIDTAINRLNAGDTLFIRSGDYSGYGQLTFQKNGTSTQPIVISGYQNEYPLVQGFTIGYSSWLEIMKIDFQGPQTIPTGWLDMPNVVVDNPSINTNSTIEWLAPDYRVDSVTQKYSTYSKFFDYGWTGGTTWETFSSTGLNIVNCENILLKDNKISLHTNGIRIRNNSKYITVEGNEIHHCIDGISAYCDTVNYEYSFGYSLISENDIYQSFRNGIMLNYGVNHTLVENNIVKYSGQNHISTYNLTIQSDSSGYNTIQNNFVAYGGYYADYMKAPGPSAISIHSPGPGTKAIGNFAAYQITNCFYGPNYVDGNGYISDINPHGSEFINNVSYRCMGNGLSLVKTQNNKIIHNTFIYSGYNDTISNNNGMSMKIVGSTDINNIIYNNIFFNAQNGGIYSKHPTFSMQTILDNNLYYQGGSIPLAADSTNSIYMTLPFGSSETNGIAADPLIVDSLGNIGSASPAIGAGGSLYTHPTDKTGAIRNTSNPTIGSYEQAYVLVSNNFLKNKVHYRVFPNPVKNILVLPPLSQENMNHNEQFMLFSLNGTMVYNKSVNPTELNFIRLDSLNSGTYIYLYGTQSGKIMKQ